MPADKYYERTELVVASGCDYKHGTRVLCGAVYLVVCDRGDRPIHELVGYATNRCLLVIDGEEELCSQIGSYWHRFSQTWDSLSNRGLRENVSAVWSGEHG